MIRSTTQWVARAVSLLLLATLGTVLMMHVAPGYFSEEREIDARFGSAAETQILTDTKAEGSLLHVWTASLVHLLRGDLGTSRQYGVPVTDLLVPRLRVTGRLLLVAVCAGSVSAFLAAVWSSALRSLIAQRSMTLVTALLICVPVSVLATFCLLKGYGGPALVLGAIIAARDFRFFVRLLRQARSAPHMTYARACGMRPASLLLRHLLLPLKHDIAALFAMSCVVAISAVIPVEVIFDLPGVGQLAWSAAMNRDLPVLFAVTAMLAACIAASTCVTQDLRVSAEAA